MKPISSAAVINQIGPALQQLQGLLEIIMVAKIVFLKHYFDKYFRYLFIVKLNLQSS